MGISPDIWGPNAWTFIHLMVLSEKEPFDKARLEYYQQLYTTLTFLLPCEKCRNHLKDNLQSLKPISSLQTKQELFNWTVDLHNAVNKSLNKATIDYTTAYNHWKSVADGSKTVFGKNCPKNQWKYSTFILIIIVIVLSYKVLHKKR